MRGRRGTSLIKSKFKKKKKKKKKKKLNLNQFLKIQTEYEPKELAQQSWLKEKQSSLTRGKRLNITTSSAREEEKIKKLSSMLRGGTSSNPQ